ncbi:trans-sialidase, putative [Trypanosoma cruzi marinkellei]|uniref:Trans-sialidase, putative n=1 Tax=Trypanosoma cruzi marinkellei TaxID=85056 RepID=K2N421_TRYCR|nr:trans-sialidase, putative [Trypanosoma cruzi marinkellei]
MSRHLLHSALLLILLVVMCCNTAAEEQHSAGPQFEWKDAKSESGVTVASLGVPGLLKVGGHVFAVAEAQCKEAGVSFTGIASQLINKDTAQQKMELLKDPKDHTQFLEEDGSEEPKKKVDLSRPTTIVEGNDIYMLVGKYSHTAAVSDRNSGAADLGFLLVKGNVSDESGVVKGIHWKNNKDVSRVSFSEQTDLWTRLIGGGGSGIKTKNGTFVFPVEGTKKGEAEKDEKAVSLILYSSDNNLWTPSKAMSDGGCSDPSVVEWKDNQLMMMTACDDGRRRVYESGDKGESWTEALGTLSRVWGNKHEGPEKGVGSGFITATIVGDGDDNNRKVMLVTLPVYTEEVEDDNEKK